MKRHHRSVVIRPRRPWGRWLVNAFVIVVVFGAFAAFAWWVWSTP